MLQYAILGLSTVVGIMLVLRWFVTAAPADILRVLRYVAIGLGILIALFIVLTRRWTWLPILAFIALPWLTRINMAATRAKNAGGPTPGMASQVRTRFIHVFLDHDSGEMSGDVREGKYRGQPLGRSILPR